MWKGTDKSGPHTFYGLYFTRKNGSRVKVSSPIIPQFCYALEMSPSHFSSPLSLRGLRCQGSSAAASWSIVWGGWGKRKESRASSSLQLPLTKASCRHRQLTPSQGHPEAIFVGAKLLWHISPWSVRGETAHGDKGARWFLTLLF